MLCQSLPFIYLLNFRHVPSIIWIGKCTLGLLRLRKENLHIFNFPFDIYMLAPTNFFHCQFNHTFSLFSFIYKQRDFLSYTISHNNKGLHLRGDHQKDRYIYTCLCILYVSLSIITRSWLKRVNGSRIINQALISPVHSTYIF